MSFPFPDPILAADMGGWGCVAVIVMMFVGWILNLINNSKNRPAPAARPQGRRGPQRRGDERLQSEIDSFLQEVGGGKRRAEAEEELTIELVPEEEPPRRRRPRPQSLPPQTRPQLVETADMPLSQRHLESSLGRPVVGAALRDDDAIQLSGQELGGGIGSEWTRRSAGSELEVVEEGAGAAWSSGSQPTAAGIVGLLRNPATVRQAILISEVLSRPRSLR